MHFRLIELQLTGAPCSMYFILLPSATGFNIQHARWMKKIASLHPPEHR